ncbi:MAG: GPW/gp25 family protein [Cytophagia bacterium]|nr:GPW/gp25 family protein [Cytophagia bacterium]
MEDFSKKAFLGIGWGSPPTFVKGGNEVIMTKDVANINENLSNLFKTKRGERALNPNYGSELSRLIFAAQSGLSIREIESSLKHSIQFYEPRIIVDEIAIQLTNEENGLIIISVSYSISKVNTRHNFVFPFYINEGTYLDS